MTATNWIGGSGDWGDASNWSAGVPNGSSVANIGGTDAYTAAIASGESFAVGTVTITNPNAALDLWGSLTVNSAIDIGAGTFTIAGTIVGGEIRQTGGTINYAGTLPYANSPYPGADGTLDGVKFVGTMDLSATNAAINIKDGLTVTGANGTSPGIVNVTGYGAEINFQGSQTFDKATLNIGGAGFYSYLLVLDGNGTPGTLTLGPDLHLVATTGGVYLGGDSDAAIVNQGTITAGVSGRTFEVAAHFTNEGTVNISNNQNFVIDSPDFTNTGTITVTSGATLRLEGDQVGSQLGTIAVNGGVVRIDGALDNSGNVLKVGTGQSLRSAQLYGTISAGTIRDSGSGLVFEQGATLDGVTYQGTMSIAVGAVTVRDGLTLQNLAGTGPGALTIGGAGALVALEGTQTIDNGTIKLTATSATIAADGNGASAATLTLGSGLTIRTAGVSARISSDGQTAIVNQGRILAQTAGDHLTISASSFTNSGTIALANSDTIFLDSPNFVNTGTITVTSNASLQLWSTYGAAGSYTTANLGTIKVSNGGSLDIEGTLDNNGAVLRVGGNNPLHRVSLAGTINDGTVADAGGGFNFRGGILDHVKYRGTLVLDIPGYNQDVQIYGGITLTGANGTGKGAIDAGSGVVEFHGTQTVNNATITLGGDDGEGDLGARNIAGASTASTLTLGSGLTVVTGGTSAVLFGDGKMLNKGTILADTIGGSVSIAPAAFVNDGAIIVGNGELVTVGTGFTNNAAVEVIKGTLDLQKTVAGTGSIQIDAGGIVKVAGAAGKNQMVHFYGTGGILRIGTANSFAGGIEGFGKGDVIDLTDVAFGSRTTIAYSGNAAGGTLTVSDRTHTAKLQLIGNYTAGTFADASDGSGFTKITFTPGTAAARTVSATGMGESRLHQFASAIAAHSADSSGFHAASVPHDSVAAADRSLLAASHH